MAARHLGHPGTVLPIVAIVAIAPGAERPLRLARQDQAHRAGVRHGERLDRAIRLGHHHPQVAAIRGRTVIVDRERPGRHGVLENQHAGLIHLDVGPGARNAAYGGPVQPLRVRQHGGIAADQHAAHRVRREVLAAGEHVAEHQARPPGRDIRLQAGALAAAREAALAPSQRRAVAQIPALEVEPAVEVQVQPPPRAQAADVIGIVVLVSQAERGNAAIPLIGRDVAPEAVDRIGLRNADFQAVLAEIERLAAIRKQLAQHLAAPAGFEVGDQGRIERAQPDLHRFQLAIGETRHRRRRLQALPGRLRRDESNLLPDQRIVVGVNVDDVVARPQRVAVVESAQIRAIGAAPQHGRVEVDRRLHIRRGFALRRGGEGKAHRENQWYLFHDSASVSATSPRRAPVPMPPSCQSAMAA